MNSAAVCCARRHTKLVLIGSCVRRSAIARRTLRAASASIAIVLEHGDHEPALLAGIAVSSEPPLALRRALAVLQTLLRRASYLALLDEQPAAHFHVLIDLRTSVR